MKSLLLVSAVFCACGAFAAGGFWKAMNAIQKTVDRIMRETKDGSIVLMHEIYSNSYDAFCLAIDRLSKEGYVFVTVSELIGDELRPGHRYSSWYQR